MKNGSKVAEAVVLNKQAENLKRQSEEANGKRNLLLVDIENSVKASRDLLQGVYRETPRTLSQFGFNVIESVRSTAKKQPYCNRTILVGAWVRLTIEKAELRGSAFLLFLPEK